MMRRKTLLSLADNATLKLIALSSCGALALAACGDQEGSEPEPTVRTIEQGVITQLIAGLSTPTIDEGGTSTINIARICVGDDTEDVQIEVDWGDGTPDTVILASPAGTWPTGSCTGGTFEVCPSAGAAICNPTHIYNDNPAGEPTGGDFDVEVLAFQVDDPGTTRTQNLLQVVNNVAPAVSFNNGLDVAEGAEQTLRINVSEAANVTDEIVRVQWDLTPAAMVFDPVQIICDCTRAGVGGGEPHCNTTPGTDSPVCGITTAQGTDQRITYFLDDGFYDITAEVEDKDGAVTTIMSNGNQIFNEVPGDLSYTVNGINPSTDVNNPNPIVDEGQLLNLNGSFSDDGIDSFNITWDFFDGTTSTGTASITKATWAPMGNSMFATIDPADVLQPTHQYDDNNNADPNDITTHQIRLNIMDDDSGTANDDRYIGVRDVDPIIDSFTSTATVVDEQSTFQTVTFQVAARSGAPGFDDLDPTPYRWIMDNGSRVDLVDIPGEILIVSGCGNTDDTCELSFRDGDLVNTYSIGVDVTDEDSTVEVPVIDITVNNQPPLIRSLNSTPTVNEGAMGSVTVNFLDRAGIHDGDYTISIDWGDGTPVQNETVNNDGVHSYNHTFADDELCSAGPGLCQILVTVCEAAPFQSECSTTESEFTNVVNIAPTVTITSPLDGATLVEGVDFDLDGTWTDPAMTNDNTYAYEWFGTQEGTNPSGTDDMPGVAAGPIAVNFPNVPAAGLANVAIRLDVTDDDGGTGSDTVNVDFRDNMPQLTIDGTNTPAGPEEPAAATIDLTIAPETTADLLTQIVVDWGDPFTGEITTLTAGPDFDPMGDTITVVKPTAYDDGDRTYTVTVTLSDEDSSVMDTATVDVDNVDPVITLVESTPGGDPVLVSEGQLVSFRVTATDVSENDIDQDLVFTFTWGDGDVDIVSGSDVNANTQIGRIAHTYTDPATYTVNIRVEDKDGGFDEITRDVEVLNRAPVITDVFDTGPKPEGTEVTVVALVENLGADTLSYSFNFTATCDPSDGVDDADFSEATPGSGTSAAAEFTYDQDGVYDACVRVCDDDGPNFGCDYGTTPVQIDNVAPTITSFPTPAAVDEAAAGATVTLTGAATDPGDDTLTYAFDCEDDGTNEASGASTSIDCTYAFSGNYTARLTVTDGDGGSATETVVVRVRNVAPTITDVQGTDVDEGQIVTVDITASDAGGDQLTYSWDWDNNGIYDAMSTSNSADFLYPEDGGKTVGVRVCDRDGDCDTSSVGLLVANVAPVVSLSVPSSVTRGSAVPISASATDAGDDDLLYTFTVRDNSGGDVAVFGPSSATSATVTLDDTGAYTVEVAVTDEANAPNSVLTDTASAGFSVTDVNVLVRAVTNPSTIDEGGTTTITVTPSGTGPYLVSYDINGDGDFLDPEDITPVDDSDTCDPCEEMVTYADNRPNDLPYRVTILVEDTGAEGAVATAFVSVNVNNVPPALDAVANQSVEEQSTLSLTLTATDQGTQDTISFGLVDGPDGLTVDAAGNLSWTPDWPDAGNNTVTVSATDDDGGNDQFTFTVTVTIIDTNNNGISDTRERELNDGDLLPDDAGNLDTDNDGVSDLDEILGGTDPNVSDAPAAPVIFSPDGETVDTIRPTLTVINAVSPRDRDLVYTFVVEDENDTEVTTITGVIETAVTTSVDVDVDLTEDATYTWYAFANDGLADGATSDDGIFNVDADNAAPPAPEPLTPLDGATLPFGSAVALELRAVVDPDGDAVTYTIELASDSGFADVVATSEPRDVPFWSLPEPLEAGTYYWRGSASDGVNDSGAGSIASFTIDEEMVAVNRPPTEPTIVGPNGMTLGSGSATLEIGAATDPDGDAVQYQFEYSDNAAFAGATASGSQDGLTFDASGLGDGAWFWRARATDGELVSAWVSASFTVEANNEAPTGLAILSPSPGSLLARAPAEIVVQNAKDVDGDSLSYSFIIARDEGFSDIIDEGSASEGDGTTAYDVAAEVALQLEEGETYYVQVSVTDGTNTINVSGSFTLDSTVVVAAGGGSSDDGCCSTVNSRQPASERGILVALLLLGFAAIRFVRRR